MDNPFVYGEVVPRSAFVDREAELDRLVGDLLSSQKIFLISPRRYGKSSLMRHALEAAGRRGALTVEVSVSSYSSYSAFLEGYAGALLSLENRPERAGHWLRELFAWARPELRREPGPDALTPAAGETQRDASHRGVAAGRANAWRPIVAFPGARTPRDVSRLAADVFALPGRLVAARGRALVVALDEFQAIDGFDGRSVEHALRAAIQHQRRVGYVFAGSEPSLMERMLGPRRPFYKAGPVMRLGKIPASLFAAFIDARFQKTGVRPAPGFGAAVIELAGNLPYDVQRLAHETWDDVRQHGRRTVDLDDLHHTLKRLLTEQEPLYEAVWQRLTLAQRAALRAVVLEDGRELLSSDARARHRLGAASTVQKSLAALMREDLVAREDTHYVVVDSLLREWVARRTY